MSVIHFHGTDDEHAPFKGGKGKGPSGTDFYSVDHSIQAWVKGNGCDKEPVVKKFPDTAKDGTTITRKTYGGGNDGSEVAAFQSFSHALGAYHGGHLRAIGANLEFLNRCGRAWHGWI